MHGAVFFLSFFFLGISKGMSEQNHVSLTCRYLQGKVCRSPLNMQGAPSVMHHKARYRCRVTKHSSYFWLLGLVSARLSCDEMAGAVCECVRVCVCFAPKVQLKCVGFPALWDYITYTSHDQQSHLKQIFCFFATCAVSGEGRLSIWSFWCWSAPYLLSKTCISF